MRRFVQKISIWLFRKAFSLSNNKTNYVKEGSSKG